MSLEKICKVLKWMQFLIMTSQKKGICAELCPVHCWNNNNYGHSSGSGFGYPSGIGSVSPMYGFDYGYGYGQFSDGSGINIDDLARAVGVPKSAINDLVRNANAYNRTAKRYPIVTNSRTGTRVGPTKTKIKNPLIIVGRSASLDLDNSTDIVDPKPVFNSKKVKRSIDDNTIGENVTDYNQDVFYFGNSGEYCTTPDAKVGACVNIRRCEPLLDLLMNLRSNPDAYSYLRESLCSYEGSDPVVCCPVDAYDPNPVSSSPSQSYYLPGIDENCGSNNGTLTRRVVNGVPAFLGEFPWVAALGYRSRRTPGKTNWQCGATLITIRHVVTAAHCIRGHEDDVYLVRLGELDLESDDDGANPIDVGIEKLIVHEDYSSVQHTNDIALVKMANDVSYVPGSIWPVCLPKTPELRSNTFEKNLPFIAGWGSTSYKGPSSTKLLVAQLPVVSNTKCQDAYSRFKNQVIDQRVLCAGYAQGGKDACQGDSGGPLMMPISGGDAINYYQIGLVSFGFKCAEPGYPGVYTRLTEFIPWVENNINN